MTNPQENLPHRRETAAFLKRSITLLMAIVCFASFTSFLHVSLFLRGNLVETSATDATVSPLKIKAMESRSKENRVPHPKKKQGMKKEKKRIAAVDHGQRALRTSGNEATSQRSRMIDSSSTSSNKKVASKRKKKLDFIIAGFPKTGTTSLLYAFGDHPEADIASRERCGVTNPMTNDTVAYSKLQEALSELSPSPQVKRAIKCPNAVYHAYHAIVRLEQHAPNAKFVVGLRHPVAMLQSYYNYRVTEHYDKQQNGGEEGGNAETIPPLDRLIGVDKEWRGVSTDSTRFELYLMQFGKTAVEANILHAMIPRGETLAERKNHHWAIKPNTFSIFLYTLDQLEDTNNAARSQSFREGLQHFLDLQRPLKPVGRENLNHFVGKQGHPETVDICLPKYKSLRQILVRQGARSARWIEYEFLSSQDVLVANRDHFLKSIRSWGIDPCDQSAQTTHEGSSTESKTEDSPDGEKTVRQLSSKATARKRVFAPGKNHKIEILPVKL
ncbi:ATP synthase D chain, mitochondrial (ATP5H) [Seminavis robusta]|uniref:ATP synthase D chain, mitochondrial (ATP5H) n=1 Tax=Seminavis robusta TaxID=568900 RepID=A0A9N8DET8_9STRA|nr:ATP synthase D chain, mitochondrial (ATP5H) [Seminavis robusta]|eukprot:Sro89_g047110.1 ATP synthase D chain, mitochondrial (ATP5H) (499) ;mRNA; r:107605-109101